MSDTATTQLRRLIQFVSEISGNEAHSIDEVAKRLGVTRDVVVSDLTAITVRDHDVPAGFVEGVSITWDSHEVSAYTSHFRRPMRLTRRELCALEIGLAVLRRERVHSEQLPIDSALEKLRDAMTHVPGDEQWDGTQHVELGDPNDRQLPLVRSAIERAQKLRVSYRSGADGAKASVRILHPHGTVFSKGKWYLVAWCEQSAEIRRFRLDRMQSSELLDERFERPEGFSLDQFVDGDNVLGPARSETMKVRYSPRVAPWIAEREGMSLAADGSLTLEHPMADRAWALRHVLQYGAEAEVLEPESLRAEIAERLGQMLA